MKNKNIISMLLFLLLCILWMISIYAFINSPDTVPIHMNYKGEVDDYGSKYSIFLLPVIATILMFLFEWLVKNPEKSFKHSWGNEKISAENKATLLSLSIILMRYFQILIMVLFIFLVFVFYLFTQKPFVLGVWFFWLTLILFIVPSFYFTYLSFKYQQKQK